MKAECEIAMKLMEKDVHEKQDTIISLRAQLEDIKSFNLEINTKVSTLNSKKKAFVFLNTILIKLNAKGSIYLNKYSKRQEISPFFFNASR